MPTKEQCLKNIQKIQNFYKEEMLKLDLLLNGADLKNHKTHNKTECPFGKWFYAHAHLHEFLGPQLYQKLETLHNTWHEYNHKIMAIYAPQKKGFLTKLLQSKPDELQRDKAKAYYDDLLKVTEEFYKALELANRRLNALPASKFLE